MIFIEKKSDRRNIIEEILMGKQRIWGMIIDGKLKIWDEEVLVMDEREVVNNFRILTKQIKEQIR
ncbi:MAG: hypothetical protein PHW73_12250, partial [Atribacterota bacterium]|nr:hypothetical protein [Atribacterota bacterium]